jgi:hypothetical protein
MKEHTFVLFWYILIQVNTAITVWGECRNKFGGCSSHTNKFLPFVESLQYSELGINLIDVIDPKD